eukprot:TRINITY_DN3333_c0_g1_i1.p1 TRINITY_DN3333_c0_g1~~TRINITY_DN3333_c0_g1_i1.p1  ORF type:complete len:176 (+),score=2.62 TRINITY_DN3333_c0_g1_i1:82-609(+)
MRIKVVVRAIPWIALIFLAMGWMLCIIGAGCYNTGWAYGKHNDYRCGWQKDDGGGILGPSLREAGKAAIAGTVIGSVLALPAFLLIVLRGFGFVPRGTGCLTAANLSFVFIAYILAWIVWLGKSQPARDTLELEVDFAFYLVLVGSGFVLISGALMAMSFCYDCVIYPRGHRSNQ